MIHSSRLESPTLARSDPFEPPLEIADSGTTRTASLENEAFRIDHNSMAFSRLIDRTKQTSRGKRNAPLRKPYGQGHPSG